MEIRRRDECARCRYRMWEIRWIVDFYQQTTIVDGNQICAFAHTHVAHSQHSLYFIFTSFMCICMNWHCVHADVSMCGTVHVAGSKYRSTIDFPLILVYSRCHLFMRNWMVAFTNTLPRSTGVYAGIGAPSVESQRATDAEK